MAFYSEEEEIRMEQEDFGDELDRAAEQVNEARDLLAANQDLPESVRTGVQTVYDRGEAMITLAPPTGCENTQVLIRYELLKGGYSVGYGTATSTTLNGSITGRQWTTVNNIDDLVALVQRLCVVRGQYTKSARSAKFVR